MHILHVTDTLAIGGKERMAVDLANAAKAFGFKASVCVTRENMTLADDLNADVNRLCLNRKTRFNYSAMKRFSSFVKSDGVKILHAHGRGALSFLAFLKQLGWINQPILFHDHYGLIEVNAEIPFWFKYWGKKFVDQYVGVFDKLRDWAVAAGIPTERISIIQNVLDLSRFKKNPVILHKQDLGLSSDCILGVGVGDIRREKGWDLFFRTISKSKHLKKVFFILVGGASDLKFEKECRHIVEKAGLRDKIKFLGQRSDVPALLNAADFAFMPSLSESGPLVLIEYMVSGLPVIYTKVGDVGNRAREYGVEGCIQSFEQEAMLKELNLILGLSDAQRKARGENGREIAEKHFSIISKMPVWVNLYKKILKKQ